MAHLSRLVIEERTLIRRTRRLPLPGALRVGVGDVVRAEDEIARTELLPGEPAIIEVARRLAIPPEQVRDYAVVTVGQTVRSGDVVAKGPAGDSCLAPCDGIVEHISEAYGQILIRENGDPVHSIITVDLAARLGLASLLQNVEILVQPGAAVRVGQPVARVEGGRGWVSSPVTGTVVNTSKVKGLVQIQRAYQPAIVDAYIPGRVVAVEAGRSVTIETVATLIQGVFGVGGEHHGLLTQCVASGEAELTLADLPGDARGQIVVGGSFASYEVLAQARAAGAVGVIVGGARVADLNRLFQRTIGIGATGIAGAPMSVILTEGFGRLAMAPLTFSLLTAHAAGQACSINGATQIRAGVIRPEIIIPQSDRAADIAGDLGVPKLATGTAVRIISGPYFGSRGRISALADQPVLRPSGASLPVISVTLTDGHEIEVLENNVELVPERTLRTVGAVAGR